MINTDILDLSLPSNQNILAVSLSAFYTVEEMEMIEFKKLRCPVSMGAIKACGSMEYNKVFDNEDVFNVHCIVDTSVIPNTHASLITLRNSDGFESTFKCSPHARNAEFLAIILKKAINFEKFKSFEDRNYNIKNILITFSFKMVEDNGPNITIYKRLKDKLLDLEKDLNSLKTVSEDKVILSYQVEYVNVKITTVDKNIFKFEYTNTESGASDYCYFKRGYIGLDMLILVFNRCINRIKSAYLNIEPEWIKNNLLGIK